ncbi:MAG: hypothetical protein QMB51_02175 [Patescibacteria group bacterium]
MKDKDALFVKLIKLFDLLINIFGILSIAIFVSLISTKMLLFFIISLIFTFLFFVLFFVSNLGQDNSIISALNPKKYNSNFTKGLIWFWVGFSFFGITRINQDPVLCGKYLLASVIFSVLLCFIDFFFYCKIEH